MAKHCTVNEVKCGNCKDANEKLRLHLDVNHSVFDEECPVYQRKLKMKGRAVMYADILQPE